MTYTITLADAKALLDKNKEFPKTLFIGGEFFRVVSYDLETGVVEVERE